MSNNLLIDRQFLLDLICRMVNPNLFEIDLPIVLDSRTIQQVNVYAVAIVCSAVREHFASYSKNENWLLDECEGMESKNGEWKIHFLCPKL